MVPFYIHLPVTPIDHSDAKTAWNMGNYIVATIIVENAMKLETYARLAHGLVAAQRTFDGPKA